MTSARRPAHLITLLVLLPAAAITTSALAVLAAESGTRAVAAIGLLFCLIIMAILARNLLAVLMVTLCIALSYNRQFYSFDDWLGDYGSFGLFWTPADATMLAILLTGLARHALMGQMLARPPRRLSVEIPMLLLITIMTLSALRTDPLPPGLFETLRITKFLIYFIVLRALMDRDMARALLVGLGLMMTIQVALGAVQVALSAGGSGLGALAEQSGEMARRATGTTGHPNMFAPFLLMPVLGFIALGASGRHLLIHRLPLVLGIAGALAIILSQSRAPVAALLAALAGLAVVFAARRILPLPRVISAAVVCATLGLMAITPFIGKIADRLTGDFRDSVSFRQEYNQAALDIWKLDPILGVGPSGFVPKLPDFHSDYAAINADIQSARKDANVRAIAPVHNVYLWVLAELGIAGLSTFLLVLATAAWLFFQAGRGDAPANRFFLGVFMGYLGLCAVQLTDFSLWWDHQLMILMVLMALAAFLRDERLSP